MSTPDPMPTEPPGTPPATGRPAPPPGAPADRSAGGPAVDPVAGSRPADPAAGGPAAGGPAAGGPAAGGPAAGGPAVDPVAGSRPADPAAGRAAVGEPAVRSAAVGEPAVRGAAVGEPAVGGGVVGVPPAGERGGDLDGERIAADVAAAVGLAEGPAGVRAVVRSIARGAGSTRAVGRETSLPLPLVAAVCGELRGRGVLTADRPARLTAAGAGAFDTGRVASTGRCPACGGLGSVVTDEAELVAALAAAAAAVPPVRVELDQTHCTVETKVRRVLALHDAGALAGRRVLVLGDDDLVSVAVAEFTARHGAAAGPSSLAVVEVDPALVGYLRDRLAGAPFPVEVVEHDLAAPLPERLLGTADTVQTDPPYTVAGATLFLTRAASALRPGAGADLFLSLGVRRPAETVELQQVMARLGLAVRALVPGFNDYVGAGVLGGTSALWHLVSAGTTGAAGTPGAGTAAATVYTGAGRSRRRYACADCGAVQTVGEGRRWRTVGELQQAGCPRCGGRTFRPRSRPGQGTARAR